MALSTPLTCPGLVTYNGHQTASHIQPGQMLDSFDSTATLANSLAYPQAGACEPGHGLAPRPRSSLERFQHPFFREKERVNGFTANSRFILRTPQQTSSYQSNSCQTTISASRFHGRTHGNGNVKASWMVTE